MSRRDGSPNNPSDPGDLQDFERRLRARIEARDAKAARGEAPKGWAQGLRYGSEFFAGVFVGAAGGFVIDLVAGWSPFGLIAGLALGFAAGTLNVVRAAKELNRPAGDGGDGNG